MDFSKKIIVFRGDLCIGFVEFYFFVFLQFILRGYILRSLNCYFKGMGWRKMGQNGEDFGNCGDMIYKEIEKFSVNRCG